jgi:hypothetical protein
MKCPGYDKDGREFDCDGVPGTAWTPIWCAECDERRRARISRQFDELLKRLE